MTGAFLWGKLPAHGDFVARGLSAAARDTLDRWLAGSIADARATLGENFDNAWDQAPPWRFAGAGEGGWTAGAMAPSLDGVGRRYPIIVGRAGLPPEAVAGTAEACEGVIYAAFAQAWDADRLHAETGRIAPTAADAWTSGPRWWTVGEDGRALAGIAGDRPPVLVRHVLMMQEGGA